MICHSINFNKLIESSASPPSTPGHLYEKKNDSLQDVVTDVVTTKTTAALNMWEEPLVDPNNAFINCEFTS